MPQLNKGAKYVFGLSIISPENKIKIPDDTLKTYLQDNENKIIIFIGSKVTGGFCVTTKKLLLDSKLEHILKDCITLSNYELKEGDFIKYKGRFYSWVSISSDGIIQLPNSTMQFLNLTVGDILMSIKSSDIAFTMGAKGPLMDKVYAYKGDIKTFAV